LSQRDIRRLELVKRFLERIDYALKEFPENDFRKPPGSWSKSRGTRCHMDPNLPAFDLGGFESKMDSKPVVPRARNIHGDLFGNVFEFNDNTNYYLTLAVSIIPMAYGAIHLGGLDLIFPSRIEKLLWKISCCYLVGFAGGLGVCFLIAHVMVTIGKRNPALERLPFKLGFWIRYDSPIRAIFLRRGQYTNAIYKCRVRVRVRPIGNTQPSVLVFCVRAHAFALRTPKRIPQLHISSKIILCL
jgi:hypothetical protein